MIRVAFALTALLLAACGESAPVCQNEVIRESLSPDGKVKAVLFHRDCGPPTGSSSQVSILAASESTTAKGNAFIADIGDNPAQAAAWGGPDVTFEWTGPAALTLNFPYVARILVAEPSVRGVTLTFQSVN